MGEREKLRLERLGQVVPLLTGLLSSLVQCFSKCALCEILTSKSFLSPSLFCWFMSVYISVTMVREKDLSDCLYVFVCCPYLLFYVTGRLLRAPSSSPRGDPSLGLTGCFRESLMKAFTSEHAQKVPTLSCLSS